MRFHFIIAVIVPALMLTACATREAAHVEVTPAIAWVVTDDGGRHESTNRYAPFVVSQGVPFTIDFSQHDSFTSPDTQKVERYLDGVVTHLTVAISNTTACFSGRSD